jgi:selenocysteine-specific translation elongation factor
MAVFGLEELLANVDEELSEPEEELKMDVMFCIGLYGTVVTGVVWLEGEVVLETMGLL